MKRLLLMVVTLLSLASFSASAFAAGFWKVTISSPANTTSKTFNVQYTTSSTDPDDDFLVELFQNGSSIGTQSTVKENGDSGVFVVTVPANGSYDYYIKATNSNDAVARNTSSVNVAVSEPPAGTVTTVFVNNGTNTGATGTGNNPAGGRGAGTAAAPAATGGGEVAGAQTGGGQVGNQGATTTTPSQTGDVLGAETKRESPTTATTVKKSNIKNKLYWTVAILAVAAGVVYLLKLRSARSAK